MPSLKILSSMKDDAVSPQAQLHYAPSTDSVPFDIHSILLSAREGLPIFLVVFVLACLLGAFRAFTATPLYRADAVLQVERPAAPPGLENLSDLFSATDSQVPSELYNIRSRDLARKVIARLGLDIRVKPNYFPLIGEAVARRQGDATLASARWGLDSYAWGGEKLTVARFIAPQSMIDRPFLLRAGEAGAFELFSGKNKLLEGKVGAVSEYELPDGKLAIELTELRARPGTEFFIVRADPIYVAEALRGKLEAEAGAKGGSSVMKISLEYSSAAGAYNILQAFVQGYIRENIEYRSEQAGNMVEFIDEQLPAVKIQVAAAEVAFNEYRRREGAAADLSAGSQAVLDQVIKLQGDLSALDLQRAELLLQLTGKHPAVQAVDARRQELMRAQAKLDATLREMPKAEFEMLRLKRDLDVANEVYVSLLNRGQELKLARAGEIGNIRLIDSPIMPRGPIKPRKGLIYGLSAIIGILLGLLALMLREMMRRGVRDPLLIERRLGLSVLASVPYSRDQQSLTRRVGGKIRNEAYLLLDESPSDVSVEAIRGLRTALHFAMFKAESNVLAVTSPIPAVGKSFLSSNLGGVMAQAGKRVLVIDADMRRGRLNKIFQVDKSPGLARVLAGDCTIADAVHKCKQEGLYFMPCGDRPPNPAELLASDNFKAMLDDLQKQYDFVLIDTPPVLAVTDAEIIGKTSGSVLMVLRYGQHTMHEIDETAKRLRLRGSQVVGLVMNAVSEAENRYGAYRYSYGYGYKY